MNNLIKTEQHHHTNTKTALNTVENHNNQNSELSKYHHHNNQFNMRKDFYQYNNFLSLYNQYLANMNSQVVATVNADEMMQQSLSCQMENSGSSNVVQQIQRTKNKHNGIKKNSFHINQLLPELFNDETITKKQVNIHTYQ